MVSRLLVFLLSRMPVSGWSAGAFGAHEWHHRYPYFQFMYILHRTLYSLILCFPLGIDNFVQAVGRKQPEYLVLTKDTNPSILMTTTYGSNPRPSGSSR